MSDHKPTIGEMMAQTQEEERVAWWAEQPATMDYTGEPCPVCRRIRVYLRMDGRYGCEKCSYVSEAL